MPTRPASQRLFALGERARSRSRFADALDYYREAIQAAKTERVEVRQLDAQLGAADCLRMQGRYGLAARAYERARRLAERIDDTQGKADSLAGLGLSVRARENPAHGLPYLNEAGRLYRGAGVRERESFISWALGSTYRFCGDLRKARTHFTRALRLAVRAGDAGAAGYAMCGLGGASRLMGRFAETQQHYADARDVFEAEDDVYGRAYACCGLGNAARMRGEFSAALRLFRTAERLYTRIGDKASFAYTVWAMATVHKMRRDYVRSAAAFRRALHLFRQTKDVRGAVYCRLGSGELALLQGRRKQARAAFDRCNELTRQHGYQAEACHARAGLALLDDTADWRAVRRAYRSCGLHFTPPPAPLNLP